MNFQTQIESKDLYHAHIEGRLIKDEGVIFYKQGDKVVTNVPWSVVNGSPTGFSWGYNGSGPNDFALNILEARLHEEGYQGKRCACYIGYCFQLAYDLRGAFTRRFLSRFNSDDIQGSISAQEINDFLEDVDRSDYVMNCEHCESDKHELNSCPEIFGRRN